MPALEKLYISLYKCMYLSIIIFKTIQLKVFKTKSKTELKLKEKKKIIETKISILGTKLSVVTIFIKSAQTHLNSDKILNLHFLSL